MNELVSIIIPTYKNRGSLKDSIVSVLKQDYENIEIIVVDDNSPESRERQETERLMDEFESNQKRTRMGRQPVIRVSELRRVNISHS